MVRLKSVPRTLWHSAASGRNQTVAPASRRWSQHKCGTGAKTGVPTGETPVPQPLRYRPGACPILPRPASPHFSPGVRNFVFGPVRLAVDGPRPLLGARGRRGVLREPRGVLREGRAMRFSRRTRRSAQTGCAVRLGPVHLSSQERPAPPQQRSGIGQGRSGIGRQRARLSHTCRKRR